MSNKSGTSNNDLEQHIQNLQSPNSAQQVTAINALGASGRAEAVEPLINHLLNSYDVAIRLQVLNALGQLKDQRAIDPAIIMSFDSNEQMRIASISTLSVFNTKKAIDGIIKKLNDQSQTVQIKAINVLGEMKVSRAVGLLIDCLDNLGLVVPASHALANIRDKKAIRPLLDVLFESQPQIKQQIVNSLVAFGSDLEKYVIPLLSLDIDPVNLVYIARILGQIQCKNAIKPLTELFSHSNENVRKSISEALSNIPESVKPLLGRFQADPTNVHIKATFVGLGLTSIDPLIGLKAKTEDDNVIIQIDAVLKQIQDRYLPLLSSSSEKDRLDASKAFSILPEPRALNSLINLLTDSNREIRMFAAKGLHLIKSTASVQPLVQMLTTERDLSARIEAINALGDYDDQSAIDLLIKETRNRVSYKIRIAAIKNLVKATGGKREVVADPIIERLIDDPIKSVKLCAIGEIVKIADKRAIQPLKKLRSNPDKDISENSTKALNVHFDIYLEVIQDKGATEEELKYAIDAFGLLGDSKAVNYLIKMLEENPIATVRVKAANALGSIGDAKALTALKNARKDEANEDVCKAIESAIGKIEGTQMISPEAIDKLRSGDTEFAPLQILEIVKNAKQPFPKEFSDDLVGKLDKAILHYNNEAFSDCITRMDSSCEVLVKAVYNAKKDRFKVDPKKFEKMRHANRIGQIKNVFGEALYSELSSIHQHRLAADAPHAGGKEMRVSEANLVIQLFRSVYFRVEKIILEK